MVDGDINVALGELRGTVRQMLRWDTFIAAVASLIAAITTVLNTWLAMRNRDKIAQSNIKLNEISVNIDGKMEALLRATGAEGKAMGVAQERQESRDRGGAP